MLRQSIVLSRNQLPAGVRSFAGGAGAKPLKLGDKTHLETAIVAGGQFANSANAMLGAFCKKNPTENVAFFSDKSRGIFHEFSKDLHAQGAFKNEAATGKSIFTAPKKGHFYKIESDVVKFQPEKNRLVLQDKEFTYDHLILAPELEFDWGRVKGLEEALKDYWNSHCLTTAQVTFGSNIIRASREFRYDNFVFAIPHVPYKNEGTSHIIYWFDQLKQDRYTESQWHKSKFIVTTPDQFVHRCPRVNEQLLDQLSKRGIEVKLGYELLEVKYNNIHEYHRISELVYKNLSTGKTESLSYGMLATYPDCKAPQAFATFYNEQNLIPVDQYTLQHDKYSNVFAVGECTNLPTINNAIATAAQTHVVAGNVSYAKKNMPLKAKYSGVSATPIFTGPGKLLMPGFKYNWEPVSTMLASDFNSFLTGLKQSLSFKLFARFEKKWFGKRMQGKIYGPPKWTKPVAEAKSTSSEAKEAVKPSH